MAKNTYKQDEILEEPFDIRHLLRASSYIKKYRRGMILAIVLSGIGGAFGYVAPMIIQRALDIAVPDKNMRLLFSLVATLIAIYGGQRDFYYDPQPHHGGCQSEYYL